MTLEMDFWFVPENEKYFLTISRNDSSGPLFLAYLAGRATKAQQGPQAGRPQGEAGQYVPIAIQEKVRKIALVLPGCLSCFFGHFNWCNCGCTIYLWLPLQ